MEPGGEGGGWQPPGVPEGGQALPAPQPAGTRFWSPEEDAVLLRHVLRLGRRLWGSLRSSGALPHRDSRACCNRYRFLKGKFLQALLSGPTTPLPTFGGLSMEESVQIFCDLPAASASGGPSTSPGHTEGTSAAIRVAPGSADTPSASELSTAGGGSSLCGSLVSDPPTLETYATAAPGCTSLPPGLSLSPSILEGLGAAPPSTVGFQPGLALSPSPFAEVGFTLSSAGATCAPAGALCLSPTAAAPAGLPPPFPSATAAEGAQAGERRKRTASAAFGEAAAEVEPWTETGAQPGGPEGQGLELAQRQGQAQGQSPVTGGEGEEVTIPTSPLGLPALDAFLSPWELPSPQRRQPTPSAAQNVLFPSDFASATFSNPFFSPSPLAPTAAAPPGHSDPAPPGPSSSSSPAYLPAQQWLGGTPYAAAGAPARVSGAPAPASLASPAAAQSRPAARQRLMWAPQSPIADPPWRAQRAPGGASSLAASLTSGGLQGPSWGTAGVRGAPLAAPPQPQVWEGDWRAEGGGQPGGGGDWPAEGGGQSASLPGLRTPRAAGVSERVGGSQLSPAAFSTPEATAAGSPEGALLGLPAGVLHGAPLLTPSPLFRPSHGASSNQSPLFPPSPGTGFPLSPLFLPSPAGTGAGAGQQASLLAPISHGEAGGSLEASLLALSTGAGSYGALAAERAAEWLERVEQDLALPPELQGPEVHPSWPILSLTMGSDGRPLAMSSQPGSTLQYATAGAAPLSRAPLAHTLAQAGQAMAPSLARPLPQAHALCVPAEHRPSLGGPSPLFAPQLTSETPSVASGGSQSPSVPGLPSLRSLGSSAGYQPRSPWHTPLASGPPSRLRVPFLYSPGATSSDRSLAWRSRGQGGESAELGVPLSEPPDLPLGLGPSLSWETPGAGTPGVYTVGAGAGAVAGCGVLAGTDATGSQSWATAASGAGAPGRPLHLPFDLEFPGTPLQPRLVAPGAHFWGSALPGAQPEAQHQQQGGYPPGGQWALVPQHVFPTLGEPPFPPPGSWALGAAGPAPHFPLPTPGLGPLYSPLDSPLQQPRQPLTAPIPVHAGGPQYNVFSAPSQRARVSSPSPVPLAPRRGRGSPLQGNTLSKEEVEALRSVFQEHRSRSSERPSSQLEPRLP